MNAIISFKNGIEAVVIQDIKKISVFNFSGEPHKDITNFELFTVVEKFAYTFIGNTIFSVSSDEILSVHFVNR